MKSVLLSVFVTCLAHKALSETVCEFLPPLEDSPGQDGPDYGIISIPGADITGEAYK